MNEIAVNNETRSQSICVSTSLDLKLEGMPGPTDKRWSPLYNCALAAIEQGIWTAISYYSEINSVAAIKVAKAMRCSVSSIHDFDWERFENVFGGRNNFFKEYANFANSLNAKEAATVFSTLYLKNKFGEQVVGELNDRDIDIAHRICIGIGESAALGEIANLDFDSALTVSAMVGAQIGISECALINNLG